MEFRILGPLEATNAGRPIPLGSRKERALLAILLLRANEVVSPHALMDELWGESPPPSAAHTLQVYVSRLRSRLRAAGGDEGVLVTRPGGYLLRVGFGELDLDRFEQLAADARRALATGSSDRAAEKLRAALAIWRGRPLADLAFEPFARVDVERLEEQRLVAIEDLVEAELGRGNHAVVVPELEALVAEHPLRERLRGQLMLALYRSGRQADALDMYRDARDYLVGELGLEPSKDLRALQQAVLRQDGSLDLQLAVRPSASLLTAPAEKPDVEVVPGRLPADATEPPGPGNNGTNPARRFRSTRRGRSLGGAGAGVLVLGVVGVALAITGKGHTAGLAVAQVRANAVVVADVHRHALVAQMATIGRPTAIAVGAGALWVTDASNDRVMKIDPESWRVEDQIPVGRGPSAIVATRDATWVANTGSGTISEINATSGTVVATVRVGSAPTSITAGAGAIWVADARDGSLRRIDPRRAAVVATIELAQPLDDVAVGPGAVWVSSAASGLVIRIDARSNLPVQLITAGNSPTSLAITPGAVWAVNAPDSSISRIDADTGSVRKLDVAEPGELVANGNTLWLARPTRRDVAAIDARTGTIVQTISTGNPVRSLATYHGTLAFSTDASAATHRGGTLRIVAGELDSIDPGVAWSEIGWELLSLTNDGLLTYARMSGPAGATIVPDLAVSLPTIQDGGRTFTFRLRAGTRYSTGAPVRASDFRTPIERQYRTSSGLAALGVPILGADRCSRARCDLSRGITSDDGTGTITFRLSKPDPAFLLKLALPFGSAVPGGLSPITSNVHATPATGPYMIERYRPGREVVLVRNPRFRAWSTVAQPAGFPARIVVTLGLDPARQAEAVAAGRADLMLDSPPARALDRLGLRVPLELHSTVHPEVLALFLNTRSAPFDNPDVRRALALAVDRSAIVRLAGGAKAARATCQILPPSFPGYQPFCPYTANPNPAGVWHAPDLARARRLIASSGTVGARVSVATIASDPAKLATGRYVVRLLRALGYRTTLHLYASPHAYYGAVGTTRSDAQVGIFGWFADYQAGSAIFEPLFTCASYTPLQPVNLNAAAFCDPAVDREITRATDLQLTNAAAANVAWARVDHEITTRAPWIPLVNTIGVDFLGARAQNYQRNPAFGILLDQLWVR
jgi:ABC-type transport system substrate-binding protein/DNA-binding SARP family transcriptional activator